MNLSQYLETMKNLPNRFSNLAFWRGVRKLMDEIVDTFEYVGEWGNGIEGEIDTKANESDVLSLEEIQATTDLTGKIASAIALNSVRALQGIIISDITEGTDIAKLDGGLYFIGGPYSPINGVAGAFNTLYLIIVNGPWRFEIAISANKDSIYYRFYNPSDGTESWNKIKGVGE